MKDEMIIFKKIQTTLKVTKPDIRTGTSTFKRKLHFDNGERKMLKSSMGELPKEEKFNVISTTF